MTEIGRQFVPTFFDTVGSTFFRTVSGNAFKLYVLLRRYVCRARSSHSLSLFYVGDGEKGYLAVSGYLNQYAEHFGKSASTVSRWLTELEEAKVLATFKKGSPGPPPSPSVWILGVVHHIPGSEWGIEQFFLDHLAEAQEEDKDTAQMYNQLEAEDAITPLLDRITLPVPYLQPAMKPAMQGSNREDIIEKIDPPAQPGDDLPFIEELDYVDLDEDGFPTTPNPQIVKHIQRAGRKVTPNQQQKLLSGVPGNLPKYPSPSHLFDSDRLFQAYVDSKIAWAMGGSDGKRKPTGSLISAIRNYEAEKFGWLEFRQQHQEREPTTTHTPLPDGWQQDEREPTPEEMEELRKYAEGIRI